MLLHALTLIPALSLTPVVSPPDMIDRLFPQPDCGVETPRYYTDETYEFQEAIETMKPVTEIPKYSEEYGTVSLQGIRRDTSDFLLYYTPSDYVSCRLLPDEENPDLYYYTATALQPYDPPFTYTAEITETDSSWIIDWDEPSTTQLYEIAQEVTQDNMEFHEQIHAYIEEENKASNFVPENEVDHDFKVQVLEETCEDVSELLDYEITNSSYMGETLQSGTGQCVHYASILTTIAREYGLESDLQSSHNHTWSTITVDGETLAYDPTLYSANHDSLKYTCRDATEYLAYQYSLNIISCIHEIGTRFHPIQYEDIFQISG